MHAAALKGHLEVACLLLGENANIEAKNFDGITPLHMAVIGAFTGVSQAGNLEMVRLILEHGADSNVKESQKAVTPLHLAAQAGCLDIVDLLLKYKADINTKAKDDSTPLHCAVLDGRIEVVKRLLENGADINAKCNDGVTSLHLAAFNNRHAIVHLLLGYKADINAKATKKNNATPLHAAAQEGHIEVVKLLY